MLFQDSVETLLTLMTYGLERPDYAGLEVQQPSDLQYYNTSGLKFQQLGLHCFNYNGDSKSPFRGTHFTPRRSWKVYLMVAFLLFAVAIGATVGVLTGGAQAARTTEQ